MIKEEVQSGHLAFYPAEAQIIRKIEGDFDVTWARRSQNSNTEFSVYFIKPKPHIEEAFGFDQEIVLVISSFPTLQARLMQALDSVFQLLPAKGRVDPNVAFIVSSAPNAEAWIREYLAKQPQTRAYIGLSTQPLLESTDPWYLRNILMKQLFSRDLFDYTLPINSDQFFFGRQAIVAAHIDAIKKGENRGLFGLRKTGKTSVLFKIKRQCIEAQIICLYHDCKLPHIYEQTGDEMIERICCDIEHEVGKKIARWKTKTAPSDRLLTLLENLPAGKQVCLLFDEVEYVSPFSKLAPHWNTEFIKFWQSIWSAQSQHRCLSFVLAGVNAAITEADKFSGIQNPVFGIVRPFYLTGFELEELRTMLRVFGKRMGIRFAPEAVDLLHQRYGGHPLLTRMICSQLHVALDTRKSARPVTVSRNEVYNDIDSKEEEIQFYCSHITSELEEFYPLEYEMLEFLATDNIYDFIELSSDSDLVRHLRSYGLVDMSVPTAPRMVIPVIQKHLKSRWKKKNGFKTDRYVVPDHRRGEYVRQRILSISKDLRAADKKFATLELPSLYDGSGPAEAEVFGSLRPSASREDAVYFLNQANKSLVEPIDNVGRRKRIKEYFYTEVKSGYPALWHALNRVRVYRNKLMHLELLPSVERQYEELIDVDFAGRDPSSVPDGWFQLQSIILDNLIMSIQSELARFD